MDPYHNPPWQYIASPRNCYRTVNSLKNAGQPTPRQNGEEIKVPENLDLSQPFWLQCKDCDFPVNCVLAGDYVAVARAAYQGRMIPGKALYGFKYATIPVHYKEIYKLDFEVLLHLPGQKFVWKKASHGLVPDNAVAGGHDLDGEEVFIGRARLGFNVACGKVKPSHKCAYVPLGGHARKVAQYEVLCFTSLSTPSETQQSSDNDNV